MDIGDISWILWHPAEESGLCEPSEIIWASSIWGVSKYFKKRADRLNLGTALGAIRRRNTGLNDTIHSHLNKHYLRLKWKNSLASKINQQYKAVGID